MCHFKDGRSPLAFKDRQGQKEMKRLLQYHLAQVSFLSCTGLPRSGKKFWKMKNFPGQGKVREFHFQSGKFKKKMKKVMEKSGNLKNFKKIASLLAFGFP